MCAGIEHLYTQTDSAEVAVGTVKDDPEVLDACSVTLNIESVDSSFKFLLEDVVAMPADRFKMPAQPASPASCDSDMFTYLDDIDNQHYST